MLVCIFVYALIEDGGVKTNAAIKESVDRLGIDHKSMTIELNISSCWYVHSV